MGFNLLTWVAFFPNTDPKAPGCVCVQVSCEVHRLAVEMLRAFDA